MTGFEIQFPYAEAEGGPLVASDGEGSDFDIDPSISDVDLQELRRELKRLDPQKVKRQLADATEALQRLTMSKWTRHERVTVLSYSLLSLPFFLRLLH